MFCTFFVWGSDVACPDFFFCSALIYLCENFKPTKFSSCSSVHWRTTFIQWLMLFCDICTQTFFSQFYRHSGIRKTGRNKSRGFFYLIKAWIYMQFCQKAHLNMWNWIDKDLLKKNGTDRAREKWQYSFPFHKYLRPCSERNPLLT